MKTPEKFWNRFSYVSEKEMKSKLPAPYKIVEKTLTYLNKEDTLLDFGCGTGTITVQYADYVKEVIAIDTSPKMIETAEKITSIRDIKNISYASTDIFNNQFENESFNVITTFHVLKFIKDLPTLFQRINNLLKPGGIFISASACMGEKRSFLAGFLSFISRRGIIPDLNRFSSTKLQRKIKNAGFELLLFEKEGRTVPECLIVARKI